MTPPRRDISQLDDILQAYTREGSPSEVQTQRAMVAMIAKQERLDEQLQELREDKREENSARIQIQQVKRGFFEYVQFACTIMLAIGMFVIAVIELTKK